jgi:hypothetical protein
MSEYGALRLINAMVIGYMVGTREVIGRGGAQAIANMAGEYAGRELVRFARQQGVSLATVFSCSARLTPGETCNLHLKQKERAT